MRQAKLSKCRKPRQQAGFSMLELLIGSSVLAVALLGHTASIFSEHRLSEGERARSAALLAGEQFMECMRSDDDYVGLFDRCNAIQELCRRPAAEAYTLIKQHMANQGETPPAADKLLQPLRDGRQAILPQAYYGDFRIPRALRSFHVAVAVPSAPDADGGMGPKVLREDVQLPQFGLPADLNGDGEIDDDSRDDDYRVVPVIVTFAWTTPSGAREEINVSTWLWGNR